MNFNLKTWKIIKEQHWFKKFPPTKISWIELISRKRTKFDD
jgi:hypothetical protein